MAFSVEQQVPLAPKTTLKTGGKALYYTEVTNIEELEKAVSFAEAERLPFCVLAGGSNMLVADSGYQGLVLQVQLLGRSYLSRDTDTTELTVGAGEILDDVISETVARGLWGLENLSHIPGSVGATPVQNVGAYGVEVADVISQVTVFNTDTKKISTLSNHDCHFSYRHSRFKENKNLIIVAVTFVLSTKPNPKVSYADLAKLPQRPLTPQHLRDAVIEIRSGKFPDWTVVGTAGSFFKNPIITHTEAVALLQRYPEIPTYPVGETMVKVSLGYILDKICGLKGFAIDSVRLYEKQALVLVSEAGATTSDIKNFKKIISDKVFLKTSLRIEQEVTEI
jgi:UDP-N-acetylmuramate dehydrogenase